MDKLVFGIGFSKTGTSSLNEALKKLGIKSIHYPKPSKYSEFYTKLIDREEYNVSTLKGYQGFTDIPFAYSFKGFYNSYPDAKFILTIREIESWIKSCKRHMRHKAAETAKEIRIKNYGLNKFDKEKMREAYNSHYNNVIKFFKDKPGQLLVMNICAGEGWDKLKEFLNIDKDIKISFPHENKKPK